jgi:hypothetical protein
MPIEDAAPPRIVAAGGDIKKLSHEYDRRRQDMCTISRLVPPM